MLLNRLIGAREQFDLRHRLYNAVLLITIATILISILWNQSIGILSNTTLVLLGAGCVTLLLYYLSMRFMKIYTSTYAFSVILGLSFLWLSSDGIEGSTPLLYMVMSVVFTAISKGRKYLYYYAVLVVNIGVLLWIEFSFPHLVLSYPSVIQKHMDLTFSLIVSVFVVAIIVALFRKNYDQEHAVVEEQKLELEKTNASKDKLFSVVSHDLRSPFQGILGISNLMMSPEIKSNPATLQTYTEALHLSVEKAADLMENLLNWSKIQMNRIEVRPKDIALVGFIRENTAYLSHQHVQNKITLSINVLEQHHVWADIDMLNLILRNLLSNAYKFTDANGRVEIKSEIHGRYCAISVSDSGIGMSKELVSSIFSDSFRFGQSGLQGEPSSGIGLMLSREFVEMQGGTITVVSEPGVGSTFTFTLPLA